MRRWKPACPVLLLLAGIAAAGAQEPEAHPPLELDHREEVRVRLVLTDVVVQDRRGRTIPGLGKEDFDLLVDWKPVELESLDAHCPIGKARDPRAGEPPFPSDLAVRSGPVRRIVLAFDYFHLPSAAEALDEAREALADVAPGDEELMVVSIGEALRVEQTFTPDRARIVESLERMKADIGLYAGNYSRLTEFPVFERFRMLLDLLEPVPGRKVVVLYSGPFQKDGFDHDPDFRRIAARAAATRVALYTVDSRGLTVPKRFRYGDFGPPPRLARLAVETGGRVTFNTNDLGLGYARAQRDLACSYTLGFRDRDGVEDEPRDLRVFVRRRGARVIHPAAYILRSEEEERESLIRTARMTPEMFDDRGVQAALLPVRPAGRSRWSTLLVTRIAASAEGRRADPGHRVLSGELRRGTGGLVTAFEHALDAPGQGGAADRGEAITYLETVELKPGRYRLGIALSDSAVGQPRAAVAEVDLPEIRSDGPFLVGPIPGRRSGAGRMLRGGEQHDDELPLPDSFEPLLDDELARGQELGALTYLCAAAGSLERRSLSFSVTILRADQAVHELSRTVPPPREARGRVRCRRLLEWVPADTLAAGRHTLRVASGKGAGRIESSREVIVSAGCGEP